MRFFWLSGFLLLLAACNSAPSTATAPGGRAQNPVSAAPLSSLPPPDTARAAAVGAQADTLASARQKRVFSRPGAPDEFRLVLRGPSVLQGAATFTITDASGQVIFREMLSAADLEAPLVYEMQTTAATPAQREAFVRRRIRTFFQPAQFTSPAVAATAPYPTGPTAPDRATWDELRRQPRSIRFSYLVGKEDRHSIAWSELKKQVVRVE